MCEGLEKKQLSLKIQLFIKEFWFEKLKYLIISLQQKGTVSIEQQLKRKKLRWNAG